MSQSTSKATFLREIGFRIQEERATRFKTQAAFAKALDDTNVETVGRWERGQNEPGAYALELMAQLGLDVGYILSGRHGSTADALSAEHVALLAERGILYGAGEKQDEVHITLLGLMWLLNFQLSLRDEQPLYWSAVLLRLLADFAPAKVRGLNAQVVRLQPYAGKEYKHLIFYLDKTPPTTPWSLSPAAGLAGRYELDALSFSLPLNIPESDYSPPVLVLSELEIARLGAGEICRFSEAIQLAL